MMMLRTNPLSASQFQDELPSSQTNSYMLVLRLQDLINYFY